MPAETPDELADVSKRAVNRYLRTLALQFAAFFGVANAVALWVGYETVVSAATEAASDAAIAKVNTLKEPFGSISQVMIQSAVEALESTRSARKEIARIEGEATQLSSQVDGLVARLADYEKDVVAKKDEALQKFALLTIDIAPVIDLFDPPHARGLVHLPAGAAERSIVGKVRSASGLRGLTVNGTSVELREDGRFETTVKVPADGIEVAIVATNEAGTASTTFTLKPEGVSSGQPAGNVAIGLIVAQREGCKPVETGSCDNVWSDSQKRKLTYCVSSKFEKRYDQVVRDMKAAAEAWEAAGDIDFIHEAVHDANCNDANEKVVFHVRPIGDEPYLAQAFFPDEPRPKRSVRIGDSAFALEPEGKMQLVGVLRETLGHVLGFRHEHTRPEAGGKCFEDKSWRALSAGSYNPYSVMHYPQCNGLGDWSFALTPSDRNGVACLYGGARGFELDAKGCDRPARKAQL